jgi:hypothetical protein
LAGVCLEDGCVNLPEVCLEVARDLTGIPEVCLDEPAELAKTFLVEDWPESASLEVAEDCLEEVALAGVCLEEEPRG